METRSSESRWGKTAAQIGEKRVKKCSPFVDQGSSTKLTSRMTNAQMNVTNELKHLRSMRRQHVGLVCCVDNLDLQELKTFHNAATRNVALDPMMRTEFGRQLHESVQGPDLNQIKIPDVGHCSIARNLIQKFSRPKKDNTNKPSKKKRTKKELAAMKLRSSRTPEPDSSESSKSDYDDSPCSPQGMFNKSKRGYSGSPSPKSKREARQAESKISAASLLVTLDMRRDFVRELLQRHHSLNKAFDSLDTNGNGNLARADIANSIARYEMSVSPKCIFEWLWDSQLVTRDSFLSKARLFAWDLGYVGDDNHAVRSDMARRDNLLELKAPLLGQRCLRPFWYYKLRHPLQKLGASPKKLGSARAREFWHSASQPSFAFSDTRRLDGADRTSTTKRSESTQMTTGSMPLLVNSWDIDAASPSAGSNNCPTWRSSGSDSVAPVSDDECDLPMPTLRDRSGTLIFSKKEQKELRNRIEFFILDEGRISPCKKARPIDEKQELRSNYIRLHLYANRKMLGSVSTVEPTAVLWRWRDIKNMKAFCAKASKTEAKATTGLISCVYNPLLRRVKSVEELIDGGSYLITAGEAIEFPLPIAFQEEQDVMQRVLGHHKHKAKEIAAFFQEHLGVSASSVARLAQSPTQNEGRDQVFDSIEWNRACEKLQAMNWEPNMRYKPSEWVVSLENFGIDGLTEDFFKWLTDSSGLTIEQLLVALDRPDTPISPRTVPKSPVRRDVEASQSSFQSQTLTKLMVQLFPGSTGTTSLNSVKSKLEQNKHWMNMMVQSKNTARQHTRPQRLPKI